jgi:pimeloyl-ACP methyl ester carboxylesterase
MLLLNSLVLAGSVGSQCFLTTLRKVETADGATIALHHHSASGPTVLLVHGISSNHYFWDLTPEASLAAFLSRNGFDTWTLDLRGHGDAETDQYGKHQHFGWKMDDYGRYDVAAAVDYIQACTGKTKLAYVGHSMGGMVGAIYAQEHPDKLWALVPVGSPVAFPERGDGLYELAAVGFTAGGTALLWLESPWFADFAAATPWLVPGRLHEKLYNPANFTKEGAKEMLQNIVSPLSRGEMRQFARILKSGSFTSFDGNVDYLEGMKKIQVPTLVIAGEGDEVAPPAWVKPYAERVGESGAPVRYVVAGKSSGMQENYGHLDLGLGIRAEQEVFPEILKWLLIYGR